MILLEKYIKYNFVLSDNYFNKRIKSDILFAKAKNYFSKEPVLIKIGINLTLFFVVFFSKRKIIILQNFLKLIDNILILIQVEKKD